MYVKITNGTVDQFPYTVGKLRRDNKNVSFPRNITNEILQEYGVFSVTQSDTPSYDTKTQKAIRNNAPSLVGDEWILGWTVVDMTSDEIQEYNTNAEKDNREKRDALIAETDWWASSDLTMTAEQTAYRQALRDITTHANWPHLEDADWPTKP